MPHGKASLVAIGIKRNNKRVNKEVSVQEMSSLWELHLTEAKKSSDARAKKEQRDANTLSSQCEPRNVFLPIGTAGRRRQTSTEMLIQTIRTMASALCTTF